MTKKEMSRRRFIGTSVIGQTGLIPPEDPEPVLVGDIQKDRVTGDLPVAEVLRDKTDGALRIVAGAALNVSDRPARRQRRTANQFREAGDHLLGSRASEEVKTQTEWKRQVRL
jgi:hypothetical protein